jgi:hypothetical protein
MPVYRHMCPICHLRIEDYYPRLDSPAPSHCGEAMVKLMGAPFGRVVGSPTPVAQRVKPAAKPRGPQGRGSKWFGGDAGEVVGEGRSPVTPNRQPRPEMTGPQMPTRTWSKPYEACTAAQRDERWRDSNEQMTAYRADCLTASGIERGEALKTASAAQQTATADARSQLGQS